MKYLGKSDKYKYVYKYRQNTDSNKRLYFGRLTIDSLDKKKTGFSNERECAKWVDLQLIRADREPVNILKRKL